MSHFKTIDWRKVIHNLRRSPLIILIRISIVFFFIICVHFFLFGIFRSDDALMSPGIGEGDLVITYRLDKNYLSNDLTIYSYKGKTQVRRIVAVEGDKVDINSSGLVINGHTQSESRVNGDTLAYSEGVTFPLTLEENEVFLLADTRENATDSRYYGPVSIKDTQGIVMAVIRHKGL